MELVAYMHVARASIRMSSSPASVDVFAFSRQEIANKIKGFVETECFTYGVNAQRALFMNVDVSQYVVADLQDKPKSQLDVAEWVATIDAEFAGEASCAHYVGQLSGLQATICGFKAAFTCHKVCWDSQFKVPFTFTTNKTILLLFVFLFLMEL